jgi:hypothetical protein
MIIMQIDPQLLLTFLPRFRDHLTDLRSNDIPADEDRTTEHLSFLVDFLETEYAPILRKIGNLIAHGEITFDLLWAILLPQSVIFTSCGTTSEPRAVRLREISQSTDPMSRAPYWSLACEYIDANENFAFLGQQFGLATMMLKIQNFEGVVKIAELSAYPIEWHPSAGEVRSKLIRRGRKWVELSGVHHKHYKGVAYRNSFKVKVSLASNCLQIGKLTVSHIRSTVAS